MLTASALQLADGIRSGRVSSREVVEAHISHIERVNPVLNAVVANRFDQARAEADAADAAVRAARPGGSLPPLLGVPCTVKESFAVSGMPNSAGLVARRGRVADADAVTVARLRRAGAIVLGVTNTSELCMWWEADNRVYGRTSNAYDQGRIAGGSSGGEGAAVGSGMAPFGLGSDIGGSIRMPAYFNGVFGHKPTGGLVPGSGQYPAADNAVIGRYHCTGPLTRRAGDLMPLLRLLAGPDGEDPACSELPLGDPGTVDVSRLRVLSVEGDGRYRVASELVAAQRRAAASLRELGADVRTERIESLRRAFDIWSAMLGAARTTAFRVLLADGRRLSAPVELARLAAGRSPYTLPALGLALVERIPELATGRTRRLVTLGHALREELAGLLGDDGVLLYPPFPTLAPRHREPVLTPLRFVYTAILNVVELPVTQVPLGLDHSGLPLGVQVAARHGNDHLTIAVAEHLDRRFGGWVPPPRFAAAVR